jgi:diguanylate cyclase (GGDEF)-like protein
MARGVFCVDVVLMIAAPRHPQESTRLASLHALDALDTAPEERFDRITRLAKRLMDVPIALVSLVDEERQWFKSRQGLEATETPRDISFCGHVVAQERSLIINDAAADARFADNPLVTGGPRIRFYAGIPVRVRGLAMGSLCVIDTQPREVTPDDIAMLTDLAGLVETELTRRHDALIDGLTGLLNRRGFDEISRVVLAIAARDSREVALVFGDLDGLKAINDTWGHAEGDRALTEAATLLSGAFRGSDAVARFAGDEFCVLLIADAEGVDVAVRRWSSVLDQRNASGPNPYRLAMSLGVAHALADRTVGLDDLIADADARMYEAKSAGRSGRDHHSRPMPGDGALQG